MSKTIYCSVTNDLTYDQRMARICGSLAQTGYRVVLVGRAQKGSFPLEKRGYGQKRLPMLFKKGKLFYLEYNLRLFFFLLFRRMDAVCAIDLDTIVPCFFISVLKKIPRVYDAHELFCEMQEVVSRPAIHKIWKGVERMCVPAFPHGYTVNGLIAAELERMYGVKYAVIRNMPRREEGIAIDEGAVAVGGEEPGRKDIVGEEGIIRKGESVRGAVVGKEGTEGGDAVGGSGAAWGDAASGLDGERFVLYQGAVNEGRCFETLIPAMRQVNARLLICGDGNFMERARALVKQNGLEDKVIFRGMVRPDELKKLTRTAWCGVTLFERKGMSNYYSLANRFFDYLHAGIPQLAVNYPAYKEINNLYPIAVLIDEPGIREIAEGITELLDNKVLYHTLQGNCVEASRHFSWQEEEKKLIGLYQKIIN